MGLFGLGRESKKARKAREVREAAIRRRRLELMSRPQQLGPLQPGTYIVPTGAYIIGGPAALSSWTPTPTYAATVTTTTTPMPSMLAYGTATLSIPHVTYTSTTTSTTTATYTVLPSQFAISLRDDLVTREQVYTYSDGLEVRVPYALYAKGLGAVRTYLEEKCNEGHARLQRETEIEATLQSWGTQVSNDTGPPGSEY